jgi:hypothetical protein
VDLSKQEREVLEAIVELGEDGDYLWSVGLPDNQASGDRPSDLARFLGRAPLGPLDEPFEVDGRPHPFYALASDVAYELRAASQVLDAIVATKSAEANAKLWTALVEAGWGELSLRTYRPATVKENRENEIPLKGIPREQAFFERHVEFAVAFALRLGEAGRRAAREVLERQRTIAKSKSKGELKCFAIAAALTTLDRVGGAPAAIDDELAAAVLDRAPADERPLRRVMFDWIAKLPAPRGRALLAKHPVYAELAPLTPAQRSKSRLWVA